MFLSTVFVYAIFRWWFKKFQVKKINHRHLREVLLIALTLVVILLSLFSSIEFGTYFPQIPLSYPFMLIETTDFIELSMFNNWRIFFTPKRYSDLFTQKYFFFIFFLEINFLGALLGASIALHNQFKDFKRERNLIYYSISLTFFKILLALYMVYLIYSSIVILTITGTIYFGFSSFTKSSELSQLIPTIFNLRIHNCVPFLVFLYLYILVSFIQYHMYDNKIKVANKGWIFWIDFFVIISLILTYYWWQDLLVLTLVGVYEFHLILIVIVSWTIISYITIYLHTGNKCIRLKVTILSICLIMLPLLPRAYFDICDGILSYYILDYLFYVFSFFSIWLLLILSYLTLFRENKSHSS